uniref:CSON009974 protein n=1 Tax=Culicoides sonorensis TaxID=179676 RepID=A0A336K011_CULSO
MKRNSLCAPAVLINHLTSLRIQYRIAKSVRVNHLPQMQPLQIVLDTEPKISEHPRTPREQKRKLKFQIKFFTFTWHLHADPDDELMHVSLTVFI